MPDRAQQIAQARRAGYNDAQIVQHLAAKDPQVKRAVDAGYKPAEIMGKLEGYQGGSAGVGTSAARTQPAPGRASAGAGGPAVTSRQRAQEAARKAEDRADRNRSRGGSPEDAGRARALADQNMFGFSDEIGGGLAALKTGALNVLGVGPGYSAGEAYEATSQEYRDRLARTKQEDPAGYWTNSIAGAVANPINTVGGAYIQGGRNALAQTGRAALTGAAVGGVAGAGSGTDPASRAQNAMMGAGIGAATGAAFQAGGNALAASGRNAAANPSSVRQLTNEGVRVTPGQAIGGPFKRVEDAMTSLPITGAVVNQSRRTGLRDFNLATMNRELSHIGQRIPQGQRAGRDAFATAWRLSSQAYDDALQGVQFVPDQQVQQSVAQVMATSPQTVRAQLQGLVDDVVTPNLGGPIDGATWKRVDADLGKLIRAADNASQNQVGQNLLRDSLRQIQLAWQGGLERAAPRAAQGVAAADRTRAGLERIRQALQNPATGAQDELFTGAQLNRAAQQMDTSAGNRQFAQGQALTQDWAQAAQQVLPSAVPDSGTASRLLVGGAVGGTGATGNLDLALKFLAADSALATVHRTATVLVNRYFQATTPGQAQAVLAELSQAAAREPALIPIYQELAGLQGGQSARQPIPQLAPQ